MDGERLGLVIEGSLIDGLKARLDGGATVEDMRVGKFVKIEGEQHDFFCLVTDIQLGASDPRALQDPPGAADDFLRQVLSGTTTYGAIKVQPMLMLPKGAALDDQAGPLPVRTVPSHFSGVYLAADGDFQLVFGSESDQRTPHFEMGKPLDMEVPVCLNLKRFVERSNGVFGKSGTGKSFLTRLLLCGIIKKDVAVNLIFDMHSEYGRGSRSEGGEIVKGLQDIFLMNKIAVFGLGTGSQGSAERRILIGLNEIQVEDIALLQDELRLNPTAVETANLLVDKHGDDWIAELLKMDLAALRNFADDSGAHAGALAALRRKLQGVQRLGFVRDRVSDSNVKEILGNLEVGKHVVLEFGEFSDPLSYLLVANVITRRIHKRWSELAEASLRRGAQEPRPLMITIEEAHKFLNPQAASQTIFGTIAREMRKYQVTLLVVDQRPSGIDDEVLSQIGTRITCQLNDDRDIEAVFSGVSGASHLKSVLAGLDSREQALILGHAVPMPVAIRSRKYDRDFYSAMGPWAADPLAVRSRQAANAREFDAIAGIDDGR
jgi:uncharacterized protein